MLNRGLHAVVIVRLLSIEVSEPATLIAVVFASGVLSRAQVALSVDSQGLRACLPCRGRKPAARDDRTCRNAIYGGSTERLPVGSPTANVNPSLWQHIVEQREPERRITFAALVAVRARLPWAIRSHCRRSGWRHQHGGQPSFPPPSGSSVFALEVACSCFDAVAGATAHGLKPSWRILARLSSTPNALASFPSLTRKM
jgi:hypothetical protein